MNSSEIGTADPRILGQLLAAQSTFSVFSARQRMGEFLRRAVEGIPGVVSCAVCIPGTERPLLGGEPISECAVCDVPGGDIDHDPGHPCRLPTCTGLQAIPLRTQDRHFGFALLEVREPERYLPYQPFVDNLLNGLAVNIERQWQKERLHATNAELLKHRAHLQELVEERTAALGRSNRALRMLSDCNQTLIRATDETQLVQAICDLVVNEGGYRSCFVAYTEHDEAQSLHIVARAGVGADQEALASTWADTEGGRGPTGIAIRTGRPAILNDRNDQPELAKWRDAIRHLGLSSAAALPLELKGCVLGALVILSAEPDVFDEPEMEILAELSQDLSFGVDTLRDRATQRAAEETLRAREAQLSLIHDNVHDIIFVIGIEPDEHFRFISVNQRFTEATGLAQDQVVGKLVHEIIPEAAHALVLGKYKEAIRERRPALWEEVSVYPAGKKVGEAAVTPVFDAEGNCTQLIGTVHDITERVRLEAEVREARDFLDLIVGASPLPVVTHDLRGNITQWNPAAEKLFGWSQQEVLGKQPPIIPPDRVKDFQGVLSGTTKGEAVVLDDVPVIRKDGATLSCVLAVGVLRGPQNAARGMVTIFNDITARKRADEEHKKLEEQLRASQKLEAIGSLAGGVAHDFNNLLSVILSYTGFAMEGVRDGDPLKNDLLEVNKAGERAAALTRQLLAFSRKQILQPVPLALNQVAAGVEKMLQRILGEDIELVQTLAPDLGLTLADPGQIEQVLMNLVVNARDAMPEGGKLTIETSNVEIDEEYAARHVAVTPGSYVQLAVSDTGCGMDEQTRARIFEPFFTTKEKDKGTGLGLSTVYGIVTQSGGNIWVYSELGQGTTFKVYLPRDRSSRKPTYTKLPAVLSRTIGTETILVVEDEDALRKVAKRSLEAVGYRVLTASDGEEALLASAQHAGEIHLLLTDVVMPRMSGRVLAQELSKTRPTTKVLYMSGYTDDTISHHGLLDPGMHFLAKPFTSTAVTQKVREVLDAGITRRADGHEQAAKDVAEVKQEQPLAKDALQAVPRDVLDMLRRSVTVARYDEIVELIETIRMTEPDLAAGLRRMADLFDYDGLRRILGQGKEE